MQHQWIPAKVGDVIKKVESHYASDVEDGDHFVVLDVFNGDDTAIVLDRNGNLEYLCYPEEYEVVGKAQDLVNERYEKMKEDHEVIKGKISEQKTSDTYVDPFEMISDFKEKYGESNKL